MLPACGKFLRNSLPDPKERREKMERFKGRNSYLSLLLMFFSLGFVLLFQVLELQGKTLDFPAMNGWKLEGKPQIFSPQTLYEYINGAADLYLAYEFQDLNVAEYKGDKKAGVTVEIYRHQDPTQAFGIYSQERLANAQLMDLGAQGYREPNVINFISGPFYVKISGVNTGEEDEKILLPFAQKMEEILGGKTSLPPLLALFPAEGKKKNSGKFIAKDFLGYPFFSSGYTTDYEVAGNKFKIFVIEGQDLEDCRGMMEKYLQQAGRDTKQVSEGIYQVKDRYHGEVGIFWKEKTIWGILDLKDPNLRSHYLQRLKL
jgi:hypothetical protein